MNSLFKASGFNRWMCGRTMVLWLALAIIPRCAVQAGDYLATGRPDSVAILPPPPQVGSPEQAADMAAVVMVVQAFPTNEAAQVFAEKKFSVFNFTPAVGSFFLPGKFPQTETFFSQVQHEAAQVTDAAKLHWQRPRPFVLNPSLASGKLEKTFSYPSGHATEAYVLALVLADLLPERREEILAIGRSIGWHRVQIARHYPSDIHAGRIFAQAIVREMRSNPDFQHDFANARAELEAIRTNPVPVSESTSTAPR